MKDKKGFTLIEVIIVMALVGIIITFVGVAMSGSIRNFGNNQKYTQEKNDANTLMLYLKNQVRFASRGVTLTNDAISENKCYYSESNNKLAVVDNNAPVIEDLILTFNDVYSLSVTFDKITVGSNDTVKVNLIVNGQNFETIVDIINPRATVNTIGTTAPYNKLCIKN